MWDRGTCGPAAWCAIAGVLLAGSGAAPWCARARAQTRCVVSGEAASVGAVTVTPPEDGPFDVRVARARVRAVLPASVGADIGVDVDGALVFSGATRESELGVVVAAAATVARGMLTLRPEDGWAVRQVATAPDGSVVGNLEADGTAIERATIPCAALGLDAPKWSDLAGVSTWGEWLPRRPALRLRARPGSTDGITLHLASADAFDLIVTRTRDHAGWVFARHVWRGGSEARGWVRERDVRRGQSGGFGMGGHGGGGGCGPGYGPDDDYGPAVVRVGAPVFSSRRASRAWARVGTRDSFVVWRLAGWPRYALLRTAGMSLGCRGEPGAWVELRDVDFGIASAHGTALRETRRLGTPGRRVVIASVAPGGALARAGLRAGDELRGLGAQRDAGDGEPVEELDLERLRHAFGLAETVRIRRGGADEVHAIGGQACEDAWLWGGRCEAR